MTMSGAKWKSGGHAAPPLTQTRGTTRDRQRTKCFCLSQVPRVRSLHSNVRRDWRQQDLGEPVGARTWSGPDSAGGETKHFQRRPLPGLPKLAVDRDQSPLLAALISQEVRWVRSRSAMRWDVSASFSRKPHHAALSRASASNMVSRETESSWEVLIPAGIPVRRPWLRPCFYRSAS
jgi:hypothetical protein